MSASLNQSVSVDQVVLKTIKELREIASNKNIKGVFKHNKKQLAEEIAKLYGYKPTSECENIQDYQILDDIVSNSNLQSYKKSPEKDYFVEYATDIHSYLTIDEVIENEYPKIKYILNNIHKPYKFRLKVVAFLTRPNDLFPTEFPLYTRYIYPYDTNIIGLLKTDLKNSIEHLKTQASGWTLAYFQKFYLHIPLINISRGGTYIKLPEEISNKKAILNIDNSKENDNKCFLWSVIAAKIPHPKMNAERLSNYKPYLSMFDTSSLESKYPIQSRDPCITKFEKDNDLIINVYTLSDNENPNSNVDLLRRSERLLCEYSQFVQYSDQLSFSNNIDDPVIKDQHNNVIFKYLNNIHSKIINLFIYKGHFTLIRSLSRLLKAQAKRNSNFNGKSNLEFNYCQRCLYNTSSAKRLVSHIRHCISLNKQAHAVLPKPNSKLSFKTSDYRSQFRHPFTIYADYEVIQEPSTDLETRNVKTVHIPSQVGLYIVSDHSQNEYHYYTGREADRYFVDQLIKRVITDEDSIYNKFYENRVYAVPDVPQETIHEAKICHICNKPFKVDDVKVRDHDHFTGKFRGIAHQICNTYASSPLFIPIFFHNFSGYDSHLFIKTLASHPKVTADEIRVIPLTQENYISVSIRFQLAKRKYIYLRFLDSFRFMASSLDILSSTLTETKHLDQEISDSKLLKRKGVFPYEYMDSFNRYKETKLPPKEAFYSSLNNKLITDQDYEYAQKVWNHYNIQNLQEYAELYLKTDILLLADIFENFRDLCFKIYNLDPVYYYTAPGLAWSTLMKKTEIELDLISDQYTLEFFERQVRGGICNPIHRYAEANNKYLPNFDKEKPETYIKYLDANNLYGYAMMEKLPTGNFQWLSRAEITDFTSKFLTNQIDLNGAVGYTLEVNIFYPPELHDHHNDLPFLPEQLNFADGTTKLTPNLNHKYNYVLNVKLLDQALKHGLKLTYVHRIISCSQSAWMKPYIDMNTKLRAECKDEFGKSFFKLMNNSPYGKTMENVRRRIKVKLCRTPEYIQKQMSKPTYKGFVEFSKNFGAATLDETDVLFNKPIYIGAQILDISKTLMYKFHYEYMKPKFSTQRLCYMDTDSFVYYIETHDFYQDIFF